MYAQKTVIRAPLGKIQELRALISKKYLSVVRERPGFIAAYLLEQVDDRDSCELLILWSSQGAVENFHNTGLLHASVQSIAADMPGVSIRRQGYVVGVVEETDTKAEFAKA